MEPEDTTYNEEELEPAKEYSEEELDMMAELLEKEEKDAADEREKVLDSLARDIESKFFDRAKRRSIKESQWRSSMELYYGNLAVAEQVSYSRPFSDSASSTRPYYNIVRNKCDIAIAQSVAMQFAGGEKNWSLGPSVITKDPAEILKARAMEKVIESQLEHCTYGKKCRHAIEDRVILGVGVVKGPVNTGKLYNQYEPNPADPTMWLAAISNDKYPSIEYVNPWFFYPDDTVNNFDMAGDTIEVHPKSAFDLKRLAQHPGFDADQVKLALESKPADYMTSTCSEYSSITSSNPFLFEDKYIVLEYHGPITADQLGALGIEPSYEAIDDEYYGEVWTCNGKVLRIELENIEASFELPYAVSVWLKDPASWAGFGAPQLMKDAQRVAKETWRMILDNASASSGPQVAMHKHFVEPADNKWEIEPRKVWYMTDSQVDVEKAIKFFNVPNVVGDLMPVLDAARTFAEEESSTPMISAGMQGGGSMDSATGAMLLERNATTILDFLSEEWDDNVTEKVIRGFWAWNMQYNPDPSIKGNYSIDVRTSTEYKNKQQYLRDIERLSMESKQDPELAMVLNKANLVRARLSMMHLPSQDIVRSEEEVAQLQQQAAQQPNPTMIELQIKQKEVEMKAAELELKKMTLAFEVKQQQQREQWEHEEKMSANYARTIESQAMVLRSQNDKESELIKLAAHTEEIDKKNAIMHDIAVRSDETKKFLGMMEETRKMRENMLTQQELKMKAETGSGI